MGRRKNNKAYTDERMAEICLNAGLESHVVSKLAQSKYGRMSAGQLSRIFDIPGDVMLECIDRLVRTGLLYEVPPQETGLSARFAEEIPIMKVYALTEK